MSGSALVDELAVQFHQDPKDPVGAGVGRPHVQQHGLGALHGSGLIHLNSQPSVSPRWCEVGR